jgi:hypothetical protein
MNALFVVVFNDNTSFIGGNLQQTKWVEIPINKKIRSIFYYLPTGDCLTISGYDKYFHYIEVTQDISGENKGKLNYEYAYLIGKKENKIIQYKINLKNSNIEVNHYDEKDKYIQGLNNDNWRGVKK